MRSGGASCKLSTLALIAVGLLVSVAATSATGCVEQKPIDYVHHPLPLPEGGAEPRVTVVLMNWKRPDNVRRITTAMVEYKSVEQVILVMNNPETRFAFEHEKVVVLDLSTLEQRWGVAVRFKACLLADSSWVLIVDDDLLITEQGVQRLIEAKLQNMDSIYSYWGRNFQPDLEYKYGDTAPGRYPIALTRGLLIDVRYCEAFFRASHLIAHLSHGSSTVWNGEDIFMSLVAHKVSGEMPTILQASGEDAIEWPDEAGIHSQDHIKHLQHRTNVLRSATEQLQCIIFQSTGHRLHTDNSTEAKRKLHLSIRNHMF